MSKLTEVLKLLCYDPETDGNLTFNVTEALTKNWEKIDQLVLLAIAAAAAYDPEGSYAVGDYCTHGGKLHKCGTAIPDGEPWTAEHWTETTVAAELAEVRASLSNAITINNGIAMVGEIDSVSQLPSDRSCIFRTTNSNWDGALPSTYTPYARFRSSHSGAYSFWLGVDTDQKMWFARHLPNDGIPTISEWREVAVAEPPQEFDLPLAAGWSAHRKSEYFKTQDGVVTVYFQVHSTTPAQANTEVILGSLPAGFRPANPVGGTGYAQLNTGEYIVSDMKVYANGDITGYQKQGEATYFTGFFTFVAAN